MTDWPVDLRGVTESVTTTRGPNDRWNAAALGIHADEPATARSWGGTRTRRNFERTGRGYVQFVDDPLLFVEAALGIEERGEPVLDEAAAWVEVDVERAGSGDEAGIEWVEWELHPVDAGVVRETVPAVDRGFAAVVEATVAASRLDVPGYDRETLTGRLDYFESVAGRCGGDREREAFERLVELSDWR